jgi:hypothetical protein
MALTPAQLLSLSPESYLNPSLFATDYDTMEYMDRKSNDMTRAQYGKFQYEQGLKIGREALRFIVAANGTYSYDMEKGGNMTHSFSTEVIGYHANTADFLRGVIDGGKCEIRVHRYGNNYHFGNIVRERTV